MKIRVKGLLKSASMLLFSSAIALVPIAQAHAASTKVWTVLDATSNPGTTDQLDGSAGNWDPSGLPANGDTIEFNSSTYQYAATESLTAGTVFGTQLGGLTATGSSAYGISIDELNVAGGAVLHSDSKTSNAVTIAALTTQGAATIDGITTTAVTAGGDVTLENYPSTLTSLSGFTMNGHTLIIGTGTHVTLAADPGSTYNVEVNTGGILDVNGSSYTNLHVTMNGGRLDTDNATSTTLANFALAGSGSKYDITGAASAYLILSSATCNSNTWTAGDDNIGQVIGSTTCTTGGTDNSGNNNNNNGGTGGTNNAGGTSNTDTTPGTPNTAVQMILTNPWTAVVGSAVVLGATAGIIRLQQRNRR